MLRITATLALARAFAANRPRKLRAIALDLDGTLCNSAGIVTDATAAALAAFDGAIIIATGRGKSHAAGIASDLRKRGATVDALVCSDGAVAYAGDAFDELVFERVAAGNVVVPALQQIAAAVPGVSFGAEINAADGIAVSGQTYLDTIERCNPYFFERMLKGKKPVDDFFGTVAGSERVNWVRCIGVEENDGSGRLLAARPRRLRDGVSVDATHFHAGSARRHAGGPPLRAVDDQAARRARVRDRETGHEQGGRHRGRHGEPRHQARGGLCVW